VARPGWLGSIWAELGPAPKKYICWAGPAQPNPQKIKKIKIKKIESVEIKILHVLEKIYFCQFIH
jgi:hypothetical protein